MNENPSRISFITPSAKRQKLDRIADAFGTNLSSVINDALDQYIELHEWQLKHIQKGVEAADRDEFASEREVEEFFKQRGA